MAHRPYQGISESQSAANADALARRSAPYGPEHDASVRQSWDWRKRDPGDLREAVRLLRHAYADEVPGKLHEGPDSIGEGGVPKMTARAEGYLFGNASASDARKDPETGEWDAVSYFHAPFRAALANAEHGDEVSRKHGLIVSHVTIGGMGPSEAAIKEGVPAWTAKVVAEHAIRSFLRTLSDLRVDTPRQEHAVA